MTTFATTHALAAALLTGASIETLRALWGVVVERLEATRYATTAETGTSYDPEALACRAAIVEEARRRGRDARAW